MTSRLWVSQSDIPWDFVICNHSWLSVLYKIIIFFESQKIPLTEIVCLRIVYAKIWHDSTRPLVSRFNFTRLMQTHFTSMKCQIGISKCVQSRPSFFIISQTTQISETAMLFFNVRFTEFSRKRVWILLVYVRNLFGVNAWYPVFNFTHKIRVPLLLHGKTACNLTEFYMFSVRYHTEIPLVLFA